MSATTHGPLPYRLLPVLRAENAQVLIHPDDRRLGVLLVGSQGSGKTAALLRCYLNDIRDADAAPIVIDPKSELARVCLRLTPPECGKRVWFLDLGHPAFGMSPLRLPGERLLAIEAAAIADNVVAALLDINANQIFQSSRRYLYHAVIGAIAHARRQQRRPRLEDVYTLLRPAKDDFRATVSEACADQPDLDQTAEFFRSELPTLPPTRPPRSSAPSSPRPCAWPPAASPNASTRRATRPPASPAPRRCGASSTIPPTSRWQRSSRPATS